MRDPKLQRKAINYAMKKGRPLIDEAGKAVIGQLADYVEPESVKKGEERMDVERERDRHSQVYRETSRTQSRLDSGKISIYGTI